MKFKIICYFGVNFELLDYEAMKTPLDIINQNTMKTPLFLTLLWTTNLTNHL